MNKVLKDFVEEPDCGFGDGGYRNRPQSNSCAVDVVRGLLPLQLVTV